MTDRQPDFVIVGASKSATTWLQRNLQQHSTIFMPGGETHYFSRHFDRGPAWYRAFFAPAAAHQIVGEKSNSYLDHPEAARRLRAALPDVRLIVQLRNPIERAWAHYRAQVGRGETGAETDAGAADHPDAERLHTGDFYFRHLSRFLELFPREQLCVTLYDDLDHEPAKVLNRIRAHIGLAPQDVGVPAPDRVEDSEPSAPPQGRSGPIWLLRARLRAYYENDVRALSQLLGRDLTFWLGPRRAST